MTRTRPMKRSPFAPAAYVLLAALLVLRCTSAWAGPLQPARTTGAGLAGKAHFAAVAVFRPAATRCEAIGDDSPPPSSTCAGEAFWPAAATVGAAPRASEVLAGAPAPPPPARGPPAPAA